MTTRILTQERLKEILNYNPDTGIFTWLVSTGRRVKVGEIAGSFNANGYWKIQICGKKYGAHRLAWLYMTGLFPNDKADHINGDKSDNRFLNIRPVTQAQNNQNKTCIYKSNTTGLRGVSFNKDNSKYSAIIGIDGKTKFIGYFKNPIDAHQAYVEAKRRYHPYSTL